MLIALNAINSIEKMVTTQILNLPLFTLGIKEANCFNLTSSKCNSLVTTQYIIISGYPLHIPKCKDLTAECEITLITNLS